MNVKLTDEEREALALPDMHHPDLCDCSGDAEVMNWSEGFACEGLLDTFAAVEAIIAKRLEAQRQWRGGAR